MLTKSFVKGYTVGLLTLGMLDLFTANKTEEKIMQIKKEMLSSSKAEIMSKRQSVNKSDTLNTATYTTAHIVPDSVINKLNKL